MKKTFTTSALTILLVSSFILSAGAQTATTSTSTPLNTTQEKLLIKKIKNIKRKTATTETKININKGQLNKKINSVKKERKIVKQKRIKSKTKQSTNIKSLTQ